MGLRSRLRREGQRDLLADRLQESNKELERLRGQLELSPPAKEAPPTMAFDEAPAKPGMIVKEVRSPIGVIRYIDSIVEANTASITASGALSHGHGIAMSGSAQKDSKG